MLIATIIAVSVGCWSIAALGCRWRPRWPARFSRFHRSRCSAADSDSRSRRRADGDRAGALRSAAILRNTIVGLASVDPAIVDAARGVGMNRLRVLARIELPLAWPRSSPVCGSAPDEHGILAIAAYAKGPGSAI